MLSKIHTIPVPALENIDRDKKYYVDKLDESEINKIETLFGKNIESSISE